MTSRIDWTKVLYERGAEGKPQALIPGTEPRRGQKRQDPAPLPLFAEAKAYAPRCGICGSEDLTVRPSTVHVCNECEATWMPGAGGWISGDATRELRRAIEEA